ncbi:MAG: ABC transporter permease [Actinomycetota bacterium]
MTQTTPASAASSSVPSTVAGVQLRLVWRVLARRAAITRHYWFGNLGRLIEPFIFLFSIGVGVGVLVDEVVGPDGTLISYRSFVAPAMLAASAMNAVVFGTTVQFFASMKWMGWYDAILATPIRARDLIWGELLSVLAIVTVQSTAFVITMLALGLIESWWGVLLVPAAVLVGFAFGGVGLLAASYLRTWFDFEYVTLAVFPLFLFSASFFPLSRYPDALAVVVQLTPLYHGVDLARDLTFGTVDWSSLVSVAYLVVMGTIGMRLAEPRLARKLQP